MIPDKKNGYSRETIFGTVVHYDSHGRKTGESVPGFFGEWKNYDEHGKKVSTTRESLLGGNYTYDTKGKKVGWSYDSPLGWTKYYDAKGRKVGESYDTLLGHSRDYGQFANTTSLRPANRRKPDDIPISPSAGTSQPRKEPRAAGCTLLISFICAFLLVALLIIMTR